MYSMYMYIGVYVVCKYVVGMYIHVQYVYMCRCMYIQVPCIVVDLGKFLCVLYKHLNLPFVQVLANREEQLT